MRSVSLFKGKILFDFIKGRTTRGVKPKFRIKYGVEGRLITPNERKQMKLNGNLPKMKDLKGEFNFVREINPELKKIA